MEFIKKHKKLLIETGVGLGLALLLFIMLKHMGSSDAPGAPAPTVGQLLGQDEQGLDGVVPGGTAAGARASNAALLRQKHATAVANRKARLAAARARRLAKKK